ncbi:MAG: hypothetical protein ABSG43_21540 [Solirubrobacteraceae bacterium]
MQFAAVMVAADASDGLTASVAITTARALRTPAWRLRRLELLFFMCTHLPW